jgi:hypothetical protein
VAWTHQSCESQDYAGSNPAATAWTIASACKVFLLYVTYYAANGATIGVPTFGGVAMSVAINIAEVGDAVAAACFYVLNPTTGSVNIDPSHSNVPSEGPLYMGACYTCDGTPSWVDGDAQAQEGSTTASVTIDSNTGDLVIGLAQKFNGAPTIGGTGATNLPGSSTHSFNSEHGQLFNVTAGATSSTLTSANDYSSIIAASFRETGGGATSFAGESGAARHRRTNPALYNMKRSKSGRIYVPAQLAA